MASIEASKPDMVVMDLMLPDTHGTELVLKIKAGADTGDIPILALTGTELERSKATVLTNFGVPFLMKPWAESEVLDRIEKLSMNRVPFSSRRS
jgi:DNA-binding response OmpR family regulator